MALASINAETLHSISQRERSSEPLEMGCGWLVPIRSTDLAMVGVYRYSSRQPTKIQSKLFPSYAINLTLAGTWQYRFAAKFFELAPGDVTVGVPGDEYGCGHSAAHPNSNFIIGLQPVAVGECTEQLFKASMMRIQELSRYIVRAVGCADDDEFESLIYETFDYVSEYSHRGERREGRNRLRVARLQRFIKRHFHEQITLADLGNAVGLNPFTCLRVFKAATGETPLSYITRCRIERARELLKSPKTSIEEVAARAGFMSHSYFSRTFKRATGIAPSQYRAMELRA